ncbi:hypothetical protein [Mucilaginibacter polytrichastri]|uniref:Outer membrane protein beta-barrel domain-containing protein n=1 Tax=Mucilaginibacter polytrichastri TaxID=1302689 RepID=A0A1Q6A0F9_9SPHI|nr:hypothetical protein [Mucilaginibacter polytrichastri]OKS87497.1 hypothetical protein RG47T_2958 [Mucilaginibacter polytrichastri]
MKKYLIFSIMGLIVLSFSAKAQIQQGNVLVGGNFANLSLGLDNSKVFSVDLTPKAAWFIQDNVALGGYVNFGLQSAHNSSTTTNYGVGALGRYYTGKDVEVLRHGRFFGEATVGVGGINVSDGGGHTNGLDFSFGPGFAYFVTPSIGLETMLKYNGVGGFGNAGYQSTLGLSFGLQVYLPGKGTARKIKNDIR